MHKVYELVLKMAFIQALNPSAGACFFGNTDAWTRPLRNWTRHRWYLKIGILLPSLLEWQHWQPRETSKRNTAACDGRGPLTPLPEV